MKFKLDENLPSELGAILREQGHDAHSVLDERLGGAADVVISKVCQDEKRVLLTLDLDFASIRNYPPKNYPGIIVLRLGRQDRESVIAIVYRVLELLRSELVEGCLWIVDEQRTRIRSQE